MKNYVVFAVRKGRSGETIWVSAGTAQENRDGSIEIRLDVLPIEGHLHLRDRATVATVKPGGG